MGYQLHTLWFHVSPGFVLVAWADSGELTLDDELAVLPLVAGFAGRFSGETSDCELAEPVTLLFTGFLLAAWSFVAGLCLSAVTGVEPVVRVVALLVADLTVASLVLPGLIERHSSTGAEHNNSFLYREQCFTHPHHYLQQNNEITFHKRISETDLFVNRLDLSCKANKHPPLLIHTPTDMSFHTKSSLQCAKTCRVVCSRNFVSQNNKLYGDSYILPSNFAYQVKTV